MTWLAYLWLGLFITAIVGTPLIIILRNYFIRTRNLRDSIGKVWGTFFNPATYGEENLLCAIEDTFKVIPPADHTFGKKDKHNDGYYHLVPYEITTDEDGNLVPVLTGSKITTRDLWPPGSKIQQQVPVERAYWVKGDPRPRNPFRDFAPVNTDAITAILADQKTAEALAHHLDREIAELSRVADTFESISRRITYAVVAGAIASVLALGAVGVGVLVYQSVKAISTALGI